NRASKQFLAPSLLAAIRLFSNSHRANHDFDNPPSLRRASDLDVLIARLGSQHRIPASQEENIAMSKKPRSSREVAQDRQDLRARTNREIDELYHFYLSRLPAGSRSEETLLYARYSTRFQDSIGDQVRALL